ncbi:MAG TPA: dihydropyrimidinase [Candidatus Dormibacteraeota bacterium]
MLIRRGTVVTESGAGAADVRIEGERIAEVAPALAPRDGEEIVDAGDLLVLPGVIDPHTHFGLDTGTGPAADGFGEGTAAAAAGGVTTFINFATQHPGQSFQDALDAVHRQAAGSSRVDYSLHLNVTRLDPGWERELERVVDDGVSSAKVYTTYKGTVFYVDDWTIYRLLERSGGAGLLVQIHAENDDMLQGRRRELEQAGQTSLAFHGQARPAVAESEAVARGIFLSRATGSPVYFVHLSNPLSVDLVSEARAAGITAVAETCPHFLCLDDRIYQGPDAMRFLMTPPIRPAKLVAGMWERVAGGGVQALGSDHCGYSLAQRGDTSDFRQVASPGIPGTETLLPLLFTFGVAAGRLGLGDLVRLTAAGPARVFGLWPRKGRLEPGADADLVLFDPRLKGPLADSELHGAAGFSPFSGLDLAGRVAATYCRGRLVYERATGRLGDPDHGRFIERTPFDATHLG